MRTVSYEEAPVWAQGNKGQPVSFLVEGNTKVCVFRLQTCAVVMSTESARVVTTQHGVANERRCSFDVSSEDVRQIAKIQGFNVVEGDNVWKRIRVLSSLTVLSIYIMTYIEVMCWITKYIQ